MRARVRRTARARRGMRAQVTTTRAHRWMRLEVTTMHARREMRDGVITALGLCGMGAGMTTTRKKVTAWLTRALVMLARALTCLAALRMGAPEAAATMLPIAWRRGKLARRGVMPIVSLGIVYETPGSNGAAGAAVGLCPHWCAQLRLLPSEGLHRSFMSCSVVLQCSGCL